MSHSNLSRVDTMRAANDQAQTQRATAMDRHVGARIQERRVMMGLSQHQLASSIGVTYQQVHKYERGQNCISAGRLFEIAKALMVTPSWFFEKVAEGGDIQEPSQRQRMSLELARNFSLIHDEVHQEALSQMARTLANHPGTK